MEHKRTETSAFENKQHSNTTTTVLEWFSDKNRHYSAPQYSLRFTCLWSIFENKTPISGI
jgi:hypothetical protein